jgi:predicted acyltransferase
MSEFPSARWRSLDIFRGLAVLGMILVNAADLGGDAFPWLRHAEWDGLTLADLVFPSFLFIVGVSLGLSSPEPALAAQLREQAVVSSQLRPLRRASHGAGRILRRTLILFALGFVSNLAHAQGLGDVRIMGVLQRVALCYCLAALVLAYVPSAVHVWVAGGVLVGYWLLLHLTTVPLGGAEGSAIAANLPGYIDRALLGESHLLRASPYEAQLDPEGLLSTLPATINVLIGALCGRWLIARPLASKTSASFAGIGLCLIALGVVFSLVQPINKSLWTSSYTLVTSGMATLGFAVCYEIADVRHGAHWARLCEILGLNAIAAYLLSTWVDTMVTEVALPALPEEATPYVWLRAHPLAEVSPELASLLFALAEILVVWLAMYWMYRRSWFLKV